MEKTIEEFRRNNLNEGIKTFISEYGISEFKKLIEINLVQDIKIEISNLQALCPNCNLKKGRGKN